VVESWIIEDLQLPLDATLTNDGGRMGTDKQTRKSALLTASDSM